MSSLTDPEAAAILRRFAQDVVRRYGSAVSGIHLFGSRARGDHSPESDADVAVVLAREPWDFWREKNGIGDLTYDYLLETGLYIQGFPFREADWRSPAEDSDLIQAAKRDAQPLLVSA